MVSVTEIAKRSKKELREVGLIELHNYPGYAFPTGFSFSPWCKSKEIDVAPPHLACDFGYIIASPSLSSIHSKLAQIISIYVSH